MPVRHRQSPLLKIIHAKMNLSSPLSLLVLTSYWDVVQGCCWPRADGSSRTAVEAACSCISWPCLPRRCWPGMDRRWS